ncbi:hypothetical protein FZEAL_6916 [Fusarium zealandicum]|uniref:Endoglucanase n=1 Tax=Fusarium zealandicum TaxID=1053134 RepID=A0A8H4XJD9_9HYPO|nr:hypothetical protein FZEAL_6916 [Fusarium zealandicum]
MKLFTIVSALLATTAAASPTVTLNKRDTTMCGNWGTVPTGGYTVYHNNWGAGDATSGSQCTTFKSLTSGSFAWSTNWSWAGGPGKVKSYSNVALEKVNKKISAIKSIASKWTWRYTGTNMIANVSYDLWLAPTASSANKYEIMIWVGAYGGAGPISATGSTIDKPNIAGTTWNLYKGMNGDVTVFSFVAPSNIGNFQADLLLFLTYLSSKQGVSRDNVVTSLQAGTEPFSGSNAVMTTSAYTISVK